MNRFKPVWFLVAVAVFSGALVVGAHYAAASTSETFTVTRVKSHLQWRSDTNWEICFKFNITGVNFTRRDGCIVIFSDGTKVLREDGVNIGVPPVPLINALNNCSNTVDTIVNTLEGSGKLPLQ